MLAGPLPRQVDHRRLAEENARLDGLLPLAALSRLVDLLAESNGDVRVRLTFRRGRKGRTMVAGSVQTDVVAACQKCLAPVRIPLAASIRTLVLDDDDELASLRQSEDGVVCAAEKLDLVDLIEDDLIVSLPMVPRHEEGQCAEPIEYAKGDESGDDTYRPFAELASLKGDLKRS